ncbi:amino acid permease [Hylemonella gracilis]|uniref:amino acid permease n=1 Tax=Hylemonella gracilis TaxID=80880 RepID=UPI001F60B131|nr:amino acid permease [Hylemonella gracilis]
MIGLIASFHTIIYAQGRQIYSLSRAGYFPRALSITHGTRKTPHLAMVAGAVVALIVMCVICTAWRTAPASSRHAAQHAVFGAMISYIMQALSFILLRKKFPNIARPYKSPFGVVGAALTMLIALVTIYFQLSDPVYRAA